MTQQQHVGTIPEWSRGDRLRKARSLTGMTSRQFAQELGVSLGTVTNAEGDKVAVRRITLLAWSMATGVPIEWLETGIAPAGGTGEGESELVRHQGLEPRTRWFGGSDDWGLSAA